MINYKIVVNQNYFLIWLGLPLSTEILVG